MSECQLVKGIKDAADHIDDELRGFLHTAKDRETGKDENKSNYKNNTMKRDKKRTREEICTQETILIG